MIPEQKKFLLEIPNGTIAWCIKTVYGDYIPTPCGQRGILNKEFFPDGLLCYFQDGKWSPIND